MVIKAFAITNIDIPIIPKFKNSYKIDKFCKIKIPTWFWMLTVLLNPITNFYIKTNFNEKF